MALRRDETVPLDANMRPAGAVMSMRRAGAVVANALSFSRSALRELVRGRWKIDKLRFDLDCEGRGEILYRFTDGHWTFHFFLVSLKLAEEQKIDRNWAQSWDAMGVLCQGTWTPEREALLRVEVPKQRAGYADYDTLVYARGNRSARLFDHVVDSLADGRQPDLAMIANVGYILRTTAFIGNGQLGTRAYTGLEPDHPFRRPYHAQMCSAFLLREYVFDLVDHMARARSSRAVRLDPAYRRYLGLGNAAATGLVAFITNHPHLMHRWSLVHESVLGEATQTQALPGDDRSTAFASLLDNAIRYFHEADAGRGDLFATAKTVAGELERLRSAFAEFQASGAIAGIATGPCWVMLTAWAERNIGHEAQEVLNALLLELCPDIVAAAVDAFHIEERIETRPEMKVSALRDMLRANYGWMLADEYGDSTQEYFWYRADMAPRDVRRGIRGLVPELESENGMDTVLQARRLWSCLVEAKGESTVAELLCAHPGLRHIVARVQSLAGLDYADLRVNWLAQAFSPFEPVRRVLAFFGLEKFEAAAPKSVRGAFLQGAPIAEDVKNGRDGTWPFPLIPACGSAPIELAPLPAPGHGAQCSNLPSVERSSLVIAPDELARTVQTALQAHGAALGIAEEAAAIVMFAYACGEPAIAEFLQQCERGLVPSSNNTPSLRDSGENECRQARGRVGVRGGCSTLDANGVAALLAAPTALDLACAQAHLSGQHFGSAIVANTKHAAMLGQLALRCAERGLLGLVVWHVAGPGLALAISGRVTDGAWYVHAAADDARAAREIAVAALGTRAGSLVDNVAQDAGSFGICCTRADDAGTFERLAARGPGGNWDGQLVWSAAELKAQRVAWQRKGLTISATEFAALNRAAALLLVPADQLPRLRPGEDTNALKVF